MAGCPGTRFQSSLPAPSNKNIPNDLALRLHDPQVAEN